MFDTPTKKEIEKLYSKDTPIPDELVKKIKKRLFITKEYAFCYALRTIRKAKKGQTGHIGYIGGITYTCLQSFYDQLKSIRNYAKTLSKDPEDLESKIALAKDKKELDYKIKELSNGLEKRYIVIMDLDKFGIKMFSMKLSSLTLCLLIDNGYESLIQRADDLMLFYLNSRIFKPEEVEKDAKKLTDLLEKTIDPDKLTNLLQK